MIPIEVCRLCRGIIGRCRGTAQRHLFTPCFDAFSPIHPVRKSTISGGGFVVHSPLCTDIPTNRRHGCIVPVVMLFDVLQRQHAARTTLAWGVIFLPGGRLSCRNPARGATKLTHDALVDLSPIERTTDENKDGTEQRPRKPTAC